MKSFKNFLNESYVGKDGKIYASKGEYEKTVKSLNNLIKKDGVQTKLDLGNTSTTNLPGSGTKVNRGPGRPVGSTTTVKTDNFQQPELDLKNKVNTTNTNTTKVDLTKRPNIRNPIYKNNLELYRKHQAEYKALKSKNNVVSINKNKSTKNVINTNKQGSLSDLMKQNEIKGANKNKGIPSNRMTANYTDTKNTISFDIKGANKSSTKASVDIPDFLKSKRSDRRFTTQRRGFGDFVKRGRELTGTAPLNPQLKVDGKLKSVTPTKEVLKQTPKSLKAIRALGALGRIAGGAYAVKDFADTARKEKALGRGKTAARLAGASRALGGYIGGGIGATLGSSIGSLPGGIAGGAAGYHYGSKLGDQIYQTGRDLALGKKSFKQLRKDIGDKTRKFNILKAPGNR